jgi:anti-sigma-K factor RskA/putative zinc finger protein
VMHEEVQGLLSAYALDALSPEEMRDVEAHLLTCEECQDELVLLRETTGILAEGVTLASPPPALREKILQAIHPRPQGIVLPRPWALGGAALAAALVVVLVWISLSLDHRLAGLSARLANQQQFLVLLTDPSAQTATLTGSVQANVRFVYDSKRQQGVLVAIDLHDPGTDLVYQVWLVAGTGPQNAGVFRTIPDRPIFVLVTADFSRYQAVAISVERGPTGAQRPTTQPILVGKL